MGVFMRHPFNFRNISTRECISQKEDQYKFSKKVKFSKYGIQRAVTIQVTLDKGLLFSAEKLLILLKQLLFADTVSF